jgi:NAD(P)-dependent dehydrogenase (short-subunit alcohol dehydrogenase family)
VTALREVRHALIVGVRSGVGKLVADALAARGCALSTVGRGASKRSDSWHQACADLANLDWGTTFAEAERRARVPLDAVVYVSGFAAFGRAGAIPTPRARELFEANFWGPVSAALAAEQFWAAPRRGTFVSVSSISARRAVPFEAHYCASKAAAARFLDTLALEHPDERLRFLSVYPGRLRTAFRTHAEWHGLPPDASPGEGSDPSTVSDAILAMLAGRRTPAVLGFRERAIDLADRVSPALYDKLVLRQRTRKRLRDGTP